MEPPPPELERRSYDLVFSSEVLEHVVDPFAFVRDMADFVRDDGTCFVGTPNRLWSKDNMPGGSLLALSHVMEFTPPALLALMRTCFDEVSSCTAFPGRRDRGDDGVPAGRSPLVRAGITFAKEAMPAGVRTLRGRLPSRGRAQEWRSEDILSLEPDDPRLDPERYVGLIAIGRRPRR